MAARPQTKKWSPTDPRHFEKMNLPALQRELDRAKKFSEAHPQFNQGWHNEYVQELRRRIAEKIGRK